MHTALEMRIDAATRLYDQSREQNQSYPHGDTSRYIFAGY